VLPILQALVSDPIPNIRFNVAKSYAVLIDILKRLPDEPNATIAEMEKHGATAFPGSEQGKQLIRNEVLPPLEKLMQDDDVDVRYYATTASKAWTDTENAMET
jgi:serine/threonine-protein phosphatase 2A regulatory subunit A